MLNSGIGKDTIRFLFNLNLIYRYCIRSFDQIPFKLGGIRIIVHIDEFNFKHKPKYHRGIISESEFWCLNE